MELVIFLGWIFCAFLVGLFADIRRKRFGFGWFLLALLISPIFAFIFVAILKELPPEAINSTAELPQHRSPPKSHKILDLIAGPKKVSRQAALDKR